MTTTEAQPARGPLDGIVVVDLTQFLAGPYATQILGDLGARVIKVEPRGGEATRHIPPYFFAGDSAYYHSVNRNKESLVLNLRDPAGRELLDRLLRRADVLIENSRPGVRERLGLDPDRLAALNPRLIVCSITGFGRVEGPGVHRPAYDIVVQALSGSMSLTGERNGRPVRLGVPLGDLAAGMFGVIGLLAALQERQRSGRGQEIDISMLDCQISMLSYLGTYYLLSGEVPGPQGRGHVSFPTYNTFTCGDGREVVVAANTEEMWKGMCLALELAGLAEDPRFLTNPLRLEHRQELEAILFERFRTRPAAQWLERLHVCGVPAAPVQNVAEALNDPLVLQRRMVVDVPHPRGGSLRLQGNPVKLSRTPSEAFTAPPPLGQHSRAILRELAGAGDEELADLKARGVWFEPEPGA